MEIKSLTGISFDVIFEGFKQAFAEYEMQLNADQLKTMLKRRGFHPDLSFAAFDGDIITAFTLNGIGNFNGIPTAYDTGTGTLKEYRGRGLATDIFEFSIPYLRNTGIKQYLLEVLQHNTKAVSVYRNLGFETTREFNYFNQNNENVRNQISSDIDLLIKPIDMEILRSVSDFGDFCPSWQNSYESIERSVDDFILSGAFIGNKLVGYSVFEPISGDITQLAVDKKYRRRGVASLLLDEMLKLNKNDVIKTVNTDVTCDSATGFLEAKGIELKGKQFEMIRKI